MAVVTPDQDELVQSVALMVTSMCTADEIPLIQARDTTESIPRV